MVVKLRFDRRKRDDTINMPSGGLLQGALLHKAFFRGNFCFLLFSEEFAIAYHIFFLGACVFYINICQFFILW